MKSVDTYIMNVNSYFKDFQKSCFPWFLNFNYVHMGQWVVVGFVNNFVIL